MLLQYYADIVRLLRARRLGDRHRRLQESLYALREQLVHRRGGMVAVDPKEGVDGVGTAVGERSRWRSGPVRRARRRDVLEA